MGEYFTKRPLNRPPVHPGEILREDVLPALGLSVSEAARRLGIQHLNHGMKMDGLYPAVLSKLVCLYKGSLALTRFISARHLFQPFPRPLRWRHGERQGVRRKAQGAG
jgi:hypothetical protein